MVLNGPSRSGIYRSTANTERSRYASVVSSAQRGGGGGRGLRDRTDIRRAPILCATRVSEARFFMSFYTDSELSRSWRPANAKQEPLYRVRCRIKRHSIALRSRSGKGTLYDGRRWFNIFRNYVEKNRAYSRADTSA